MAYFDWNLCTGMPPFISDNLNQNDKCVKKLHLLSTLKPTLSVYRVEVEVFYGDAVSALCPK